MLITILVSCQTKDPIPKSVCEYQTSIQHAGPLVSIEIKGAPAGTSLSLIASNGSASGEMITGDFMTSMDYAASGEKYSFGVNICPLLSDANNGFSQPDKYFTVTITQPPYVETFTQKLGKPFYYVVK